MAIDLGPRVIFCPKCREWVSKWHKHWGKADYPAIPKVNAQEKNDD